MARLMDSTMITGETDHADKNVFNEFPLVY